MPAAFWELLTGNRGNMEQKIPEQIRSFIAIELPEKVKSSLKQIQELLKKADPAAAKWVDPQSIHLTLKFLGNIKEDQIPAVSQVMRMSVEGISPFDLQIKGIGAFPNLRKVQTIWIGLNGDLETLQRLQKKIESYLAPLGFLPENRPFTPHLTLARVRDTTSLLQRQNMGELIANTKIESNLVIRVDSISLMRSQLTRSGAIYNCLVSIDL
jgi:2'-5' RNA ligase